MTRLNYLGVLAAVAVATPAPTGNSLAEYNRAALVGALGQIEAPAATITTQSTHIKSTVTFATSSPTGEPCAQISALQAKNVSSFPANIALACLQSVPLQKKEDAEQLIGLKALIQFQSDLVYLENPPPGYPYPGVDILGGLDELAQKLDSDFYTNEYDFQLDIFKLVQSAYDGHFSYIADIVNVFTFQRFTTSTPTTTSIADLFNIFSVSADGFSLPDIYAFTDALALVEKNSSRYTPSPIIQINGEEVETFLNNYATLNNNAQDPDANYNINFPNIPDQGNLGFAFAASRFYQGTDTIIKFENGTTAHVFTGAVTSESFKGVTDGATFVKKFLTGNATKEIGSLNGKKKRATPTSSSKSNPISVVSTEVPYKPIPTTGVKPVIQGFPEAIATAPDGSIAGFFPASLPNTAVLQIGSFDPSADVNFEDITRELLATAKAAGKTRLIIDLRGNGGGEVALAADTFKQLFPSLTPFGAHNYRAQPILDFIGTVTSNRLGNVSTSQVRGSAKLLDEVDPFNFKEDLNASGDNFNSWQEVYGPRFRHGGNFTSLVRNNLSDTIQNGVPVYGFGTDTKPQPQTFQAEDMVLLYDGICASTCAVFSEYMKSQGLVKSVVVGGRKQDGPMQGVGAIKGSEIEGMYQLMVFLEAAAAVANKDEKSLFRQDFSDLIAPMNVALNRASVGGGEGLQASVNYRNNIRMGDDSETPLQYVYEAANCRFFYTAAMYLKQELVWDTAYSLMFGNGTCVKGSTGQNSSLPGIGYINSPPPANDENFFGANRTVFPSSVLGNSVPKASGSAAPSLMPTSSTTTSPSTSSSGTTSPTSPSQGGAMSPRWSIAAVILTIFSSVLLL